MRKSSERLKRKAYMAVIAIGALVLINPAFANEREIHLKGTSNTRDIGGYQTSDLLAIRSGQIIRSENLSRLTADDFRKLEEIGVKTVIDLRTAQEHEDAPTNWQGENPPRFYHFPVGDAHNNWFRAQRRMIRNNRFTEEQALEHMVEGYRMIAKVGPPSYRKLMDVVLDESNWPILIHCNAGKDRDTIMDEFLLTNEMSRAEEKAEFLSKKRKNSSTGRNLGRSPSASAWFPILGVKPEMLEAFYASIDERYGSMDAFLTELGADQEARSALSASLTAEQPKLAMGE